MALLVLVLADPADPPLAALAQVAGDVSFVIGKTAATFEQSAANADVVLAWSTDGATLANVLAMAPGVRWVHTGFAGVEGLLSPALLASCAVFTNTRGVYSRSLAEFALGAMFSFAKDFTRMRNSQIARRWDPFDVQMLANATLGVLGYGDIGRAVGSLGRAVGMNVLALRRRPERSREDPLQPEMLTSAREICARSDYVVLAAPLTPETRHMVGEDELAAMKASAVLINVGRGALVCEAALVSALERRAIKGAALDVFETEPLPPHHAFFSLPNVLLSPHCADHTATWRDDAMRCFIDNLSRFRAGEELENLVDKARGY